MIQKRSILDQEITHLREDILRMGSMVTEAIDLSLQALDQRDIELAKQIQANDMEVNRLRYEVERIAFQVLATQQPMAVDLRTVISSIHIATELERMGDHAAGIAQVVERLEDQASIDSLHKIPKMGQQVNKMINQALDAFVTHDAEKAFTLINRDDKLDKHYSKLIRRTLEEMEQNEGYIQRAIYLTWIGHNLERIGDRAVNIAERAIFMVTSHYVELDHYDPD